MLDDEVCWRTPPKVRVDRLSGLADFIVSRVAAQRRIFMLHERALLSGAVCVIRIELYQRLIDYLLMKLFQYTEIGRTPILSRVEQLADAIITVMRVNSVFFIGETPDFPVLPLFRLH